MEDKINTHSTHKILYSYAISKKKCDFDMVPKFRYLNLKVFNF